MPRAGFLSEPRYFPAGLQYEGPYQDDPQFLSFVGFAEAIGEDPAHLLRQFVELKQ